MCQKQPGRRCSAYAAQRLSRLQQRASQGRLKDPEQLRQAQRQYDATGRGIASLRERVTTGNADASILQRYHEALEERQRTSGSSPRDRKPASVRRLVPREKGTYGQYYAQNDTKHFGDGSVAGSKFTDPHLHTTEDVVDLARTQRGSLAGDDREAFIALGASEQAFRPGIRYLLVRTSGSVGIIHSSTLDDQTAVRVRRDKIGAPCSASVEVSEQPTTDYACIVIGQDDEGHDLVFSTFPGPPTTPGTGTLDTFEGQSLTVKQIREIYGHDVHLGTRLALPSING